MVKIGVYIYGTEVIAKLKKGYHFFGPLYIKYRCKTNVTDCFHKFQKNFSPHQFTKHK